MKQVWLTTLDNPFDPFDQFNDWKEYDERMGYYTCAYIARIARTSEALTDEKNAEALEAAINEIVSFNLLGIYLKIER